ncbi:NADPH-dependent 7-cyano-7-deazaguanine reductase QueF [Congregibacter litoralis]|uniref:7-cyano-7-deazaguanine reductase n=1 Tax=Congregibacter litoralis KT71 TaxID=314285 RepID=A4A3I6_9GAMM|nr:NADPH-dependent 7-cyano-7-deazaguanine reductase QueF [Congregibacter litoralis]EAQ99259.1 7-cyano-7-deazaguanine reductase [Congregibacter litoralis KT71]
MSGDALTHDKGPLLGQQVVGSEQYDPSLLFPVPRSNARASLPEQRFQGFGEDIWHAYELSWLSAAGMPQAFVGTFAIPATSANLIESKSLKLYLNSLNNHRFTSAEAARQTIVRDLSEVAGAPVSLTLGSPEDPAFRGEDLPGSCLDDLEVTVPDAADPVLLTGVAGDGLLYTHLMRSLCPVTAQPDWATVVVETRGVAPESPGLLRYLLAYRNHQEFHEQCVERIYTDILDRLQPDYLSVHALYTRRGGLDISPWRCSEHQPAPRYRLNRQ